MSLYSVIAGTLSSLFQFGGPTSSGIKQGTASSLESRNATDAAYVNHRGADPLVADDLTTKRYVDGSSGVGGVVRVISVPIALLATTSSVASIPAGSTILDARIDVTTPYSAGATIVVGQTGSTSAFAAAGDSAPTVAGLYQKVQRTASGALLPLLVTIAGAPAAGVAVVQVQYCTPIA